MKYLLIILGALIVVTGCEKIVAKDISNEVPVLILPVSGAQVTSNPVHFKWEEMEGASKYHLMIVSPNFASPEAYILDSTIIGTDFHLDLDSANYELKLVGVNGGYRSDTLGPIAFEVSAENTGSSSNLVLSSPSQGAYVNSAFNGNFSWVSLTNVENYEFSLRTGTNFTTGTVLETQPGITTSNHNYTASLPEGEYVWRVTANFSSGASTFTTQTFAVDTTLPNQAGLLTPFDNSSQFLGTINFTWDNGNDPGNIKAPVVSKLEVSQDQGFVNSTTYTVNGASESLDFSTAGTYYWRVSNVDGAGNEAAVSGIYSFTIQ